jgi:hypothetical protein
VAARWGEVLGVPVSSSDGQTSVLRVDGGEVRFECTEDEHAEGMVEIAVELPRELPGGGEAIKLGGVRIRRFEPLG